MAKWRLQLAPGGRGGEAGVLEAEEGREEVGEEEEKGVYYF
jgi:hypothetical protein